MKPAAQVRAAGIGWTVACLDCGAELAGSFATWTEADVVAQMMADSPGYRPPRAVRESACCGYQGGPRVYLDVNVGQAQERTARRAAAGAGRGVLFVGWLVVQLGAAVVAAWRFRAVVLAVAAALVTLAVVLRAQVSVPSIRAGAGLLGDGLFASLAGWGVCSLAMWGWSRMQRYTHRQRQADMIRRAAFERYRADQPMR